LGHGGIEGDVGWTVKGGRRKDRRIELCTSMMRSVRKHHDGWAEGRGNCGLCRDRGSTGNGGGCLDICIERGRRRTVRKRGDRTLRRGWNRRGWRRRSRRGRCCLPFDLVGADGHESLVLETNLEVPTLAFGFLGASIRLLICVFQPFEAREERLDGGPSRWNCWGLPFRMTGTGRITRWLGAPQHTWMRRLIRPCMPGWHSGSRQDVGTGRYWGLGCTARRHGDGAYPCPGSHC
jgi:hypothetical protein